MQNTNGPGTEWMKVMSETNREMVGPILKSTLRGALENIKDGEYSSAIEKIEESLGLMDLLRDDKLQGHSRRSRD